MKRFLAVLLVMFAILPSNSAYSKIIRDAELGGVYKFAKNAEITLIDFSFVNEILVKIPDYLDTYNALEDLPKGLKYNGDEKAALLRVSIKNLKANDFLFNLDTIKVTAFYEDEDGVVLYQGIAYQYSTNKPECVMFEYKIGYTTSYYTTPYYKKIAPRYSRDFACLCVLPESIVNNRKSTLKMIIRIGEDELTYNIRK